MGDYHVASLTPKPNLPGGYGSRLPSINDRHRGDGARAVLLTETDLGELAVVESDRRRTIWMLNWVRNPCTGVVPVPIDTHANTVRQFDGEFCHPATVRPKTPVSCWRVCC